MIQIYHNTRCGKSRAAIALLENSKQPYEIIKYLEDQFTLDGLALVIKKLNIMPIDLVRKNETIWKEHFKNQTFSNEEVIKIMIEFPVLIERPIIINGDKGVIGRPTEKILEII